jgi:molecular chaperone HtpG
MGANLARILRAAGQPVPGTRPILEINPSHPMVERLKAETPRFDDWSALLYEQALLAEGSQLDDPAGFVKRLNSLLLELTPKG